MIESIIYCNQLEQTPATYKPLSLQVQTLEDKTLERSSPDNTDQPPNLSNLA